MKISNLTIKNYRNIRAIDIKLGNITAFIGNNNSGKSNILRAITLPFLSNDIGYNGKNLSWSDINNEAKEKYYDYIFSNQKAIMEETVEVDHFLQILPRVTIEVELEPTETELYFVKDLSCDISDDGNVRYGILYEFFPKNVKDVLSRIREVFTSQEIEKQGKTELDISEIESIKMNLLPIDLYTHSIKVTNKNTSIPYDVLKLFKYTSLIAERDDFSQSTDRIGSKSLVKLLHMKLTTDSKIAVEKEYTKFFEKLKNLSDMENIINWQENSEIENAKEFFEKITILPNMPNMNSLLSSVKLGYSDEHLSAQGLGHRNLILLLVLLNSFMDKKEDTAFSVITLEEPEAHLCINNKKIMSSYMNTFAKKNNSVQLFYSTHSTEFINKLDFDSVVMVNNGGAFSLATELSQDGKDYLSKTPNLDLYKLFFSKRCILVEGLTEELFIRSYFNSKQTLSDVEVISFHKGFKNIMDIWLKLNRDGSNKLGIVRDFDNEPNAQKAHEEYNYHGNICVTTTQEYTLEPEIVNTGDNFSLLNKYFTGKYGWEITNEESLSTKWQNSKSTVMLQLCKDIANNELADLQMPKHIQMVIDFLSHGNKTDSHSAVREGTLNC
ncbi:recombination protein F [Enterococcus durans]|uniref:ATP-dependent nuclease n=1 Tax=Enterococcus durans TaxID=53345 RepID=UPI000DFCC3AA|nr:AAA family ATPase [Enterococcus durans]STQ48387.1 recombination protein F [Enterococcus durans]